MMNISQKGNTPIFVKWPRVFLGRSDEGHIYNKFNKQLQMSHESPPYDSNHNNQIYEML
jgi:hypothetical protein